MDSTKIISIILAVLSFAVIFLTGIFTDILKESNRDQKPYSFHKFQLWLWTLVILPSFILNWGYVNPVHPMINMTALILLGIAGGNTIFAEIIAAAQRADPKLPSVKSRDILSTTFWSDILKDDNGQLSLGRLQQLMFSFIYVIIYLVLFFPSKKYPDFDNNAFELMGISTGTYLLGKSMYK